VIVTAEVIYLYLGAGIAWPYRDSLRAGQSGDRVPLGAKFSAFVHSGPGGPTSLPCSAYPVIPGVKWPGRGVNHPSQLSAQVKERVELYICSPSLRS
jgi:hypothetical protein